MEDTLKEVISKLNKIKIYGTIGDDDKVNEIIQTISDDELELVEISAKVLLKMVEQIKEMREESQ